MRKIHAKIHAFFSHIFAVRDDLFSGDKGGETERDYLARPGLIVPTPDIGKAQGLSLGRENPLGDCQRRGQPGRFNTKEVNQAANAMGVVPLNNKINSRFIGGLKFGPDARIIGG